MTTRVLIADDHAVIRYGVRVLLELAGFEIAAEAGDGHEVLRLVHELQPDVVIVDITMPGLNGIEVLEILKKRSPKTRTLVLSTHSDSEHVHRAFTAGASGYIPKGSASEEILSATRAIAAGREYLSPELEMRRTATSEPTGQSPLEALSSRERQVLQLVAEGHSSAKIAALVCLSPKSVDTYRSRLMRKLGVTDITALVKFAVQHGLTPSS